MLKFPNNFFWGAATSAYQVEGNNDNADWWPWEKKVGHEQSGLACRHYELFAQDFDLAKSLNHNAHRFSVEWARIEPQEGNFPKKEIEHYIDVLKALKARGIEPVVTLHHFTNPIWMSESGGWEEKRCLGRFLRYAEVVIRALAPHVRYWITINEPTIIASHAYLFGWWPPQMKSLRKTIAVQEHMIEAHIQCYHLIHKIYKELNLPNPQVSLSHHMQAVVSCEDNFLNRSIVRFRDWFVNFYVLDKVTKAQSMDFIGVNYYSRHLVHAKDWKIWIWIMQPCERDHHPVKKNFLGWDIYPQGLYQVLLALKKYNLPVIITENGICTSDDNLRWEFIQDHLKSVHRAMKDGVDMQGYLCWSLLDNFEWDKGFGPRFGLIHVDYKTQVRTVKESAKKLAEVYKTGILE